MQNGDLINDGDMTVTVDLWWLHYTSIKIMTDAKRPPFPYFMWNEGQFIQCRRIFKSFNVIEYNLLTEFSSTGIQENHQ